MILWTDGMEPRHRSGPKPGCQAPGCDQQTTFYRCLGCGARFCDEHKFMVFGNLCDGCAESMEDTR